MQQQLTHPSTEQMSIDIHIIPQKRVQPSHTFLFMEESDYKDTYFLVVF